MNGIRTAHTQLPLDNAPHRDYIYSDIQVDKNLFSTNRRKW
jgi:hypothetical protein